MYHIYTIYIYMYIYIYLFTHNINILCNYVYVYVCFTYYTVMYMYIMDDSSAPEKNLVNATKPPNPSYPWIHHLTVAKQLQHLDPMGPGSWCQWKLSFAQGDLQHISYINHPCQNLEVS